MEMIPMGKERLTHWERGKGRLDHPDSPHDIPNLDIDGATKTHESDYDMKAGTGPYP